MFGVNEAQDGLKIGWEGGVIVVSRERVGPEWLALALALAGLDFLVFFGSKSALTSSVGWLRMLVLGAPGHVRGPAFTHSDSFC